MIQFARFSSKLTYLQWKLFLWHRRSMIDLFIDWKILIVLTGLINIFYCKIYHIKFWLILIINSGYFVAYLNTKHCSRQRTLFIYMYLVCLHWRSQWKNRLHRNQSRLLGYPYAEKGMLSMPKIIMYGPYHIGHITCNISDGHII